jgi:hypothetical protein
MTIFRRVTPAWPSTARCRRPGPRDWSAGSPGPQHTIDALRRLVSPGGRRLFGEGFWEHPPSPAEIAAMWPGITAEDHYDLAGLVDAAISAGFRPEWIETASLEEWDDFESGVEKADDRLSIWLRGSRGRLGFAYLTLIPVQ